MRFVLSLALASTLAHASPAEDVFKRLGIASVQIDLSSTCLVEDADMSVCQGLVLDPRYYHSRDTKITLRGKGVPLKAIGTDYWVQCKIDYEKAIHSINRKVSGYYYNTLVQVVYAAGNQLVGLYGDKVDMTARKERLTDKAEIEAWSFHDYVGLVPREEYRAQVDGYIALAQQVRERMGDRDYEYSSNFKFNTRNARTNAFNADVALRYLGGEAALKSMIQSCGGTLDGLHQNLDFTWLDHQAK